MDSNQERMPIAHNVRNVLRSFRAIATSFSHEIDSLDDKIESKGLPDLLIALENENTRFKMWAGNLGAHQSGPASLDHRLREAPHIQDQVIYLLRDISESLEDTIILIPQKESPKNSENKENKLESLPGGSDRESEDSFTDLDDDESIPANKRLSMFCTDIAEAIDCLLRLSLAIANPAPHERFRKLGAGPDEDVSFYEAHDICYVQDKFPNISQELPDILGKSITRRRQFFKYREAHHAKLAAGLDEEIQKDTSRTEIVPNTVASSLPERFTRSGVIDEDSRSDIAMSETSYASSAGYLMLEDGEMKPASPLKVPPRPQEADTGIFECPYCYRMISANTRGAWKRHIFGDLRPYTCLFSRCVESNMDFDRRHLWQLHVSQYHWHTWSCPFNCTSTFTSGVQLGDHIRHQHLPNASDEHISTVVARGKVSVLNDVIKECPFCRQPISELKSYIKHVGLHLEQLALFALPSIGNEQLKDGDESGELNDWASELVAILAYDDNCETSSKARELPETGDTSGRHAMTFEKDGEGDATVDEVPGGHDSMPSAAAPISSGQLTFEPAEIRNRVPLSKIERKTLQARIAKQLSNLSLQSRTQLLKKFEENLQKRILDDIMADILEIEVPIGSKEQERLPIEPSDEAGPVAQDFEQTYTRFARKHLSLETLREFNVGFDLDADPEYVLVRRRVPEWEQDRMWEHTKLIREKRDKFLREETPYWSDEHEFESVRETDRRHAKSPSRFHGHGDKDLDELLELFKPVHNYYDSFGNQSPKPGKRSTSPPPGLPSVHERERIYIRTTSRERGAPPSPYPPPQVLRGPTIEREVITHYRDTDHSALPEDKNTLCRNALIYGYCRYEDQGCAFSHDQNKNDSKTQGQGEREYQSD